MKTVHEVASALSNGDVQKFSDSELEIHRQNVWQQLPGNYQWEAVYLAIVQEQSARETRKYSRRSIGIAIFALIISSLSFLLSCLTLRDSFTSSPKYLQEISTANAQLREIDQSISLLPVKIASSLNSVPKKSGR